MFFYGVRPIAIHLLNLQKVKSKFARELFIFWWGFCAKYTIPWAIYWLIIMTVAKDTQERYENYHIGWQIIGIIIPVVGVILFIVPTIFGKSQGDGTFKSAFAIKEDADPSKVQPGNSSQLQTTEMAMVDVTGNTQEMSKGDDPKINQ